MTDTIAVTKDGARLKSPRRQKGRFGLRAFLWGLLISAVFIVPSMIMDGGVFMYGGDYNMQVIPFYQTMVDAIQSGNTGWSQYTDLGSSFIGSYSYYGLGSPFFWLMVPFPSEWVPYLMGPITILKFGCSSLAAYIYLRRYVRDKRNAVIGAMLYAFSGFAIYNLVFHFLDVLVFFPLLLTAMDSFIFEKKRGTFAFMVALCCLVNYYFFVAEVVFCVIYWVVRMATKSFKMERKEILYMVFEAVLGLGMSLILLLPSIYATIGNDRFEDNSLTGWFYWVYEDSGMYAEIILSLFFPPEIANYTVYNSEYYSSWQSINCWLPLFSMAGVFAVMFNKRRNKWIRVLYGVCALFAFVPVLNSAFQLFTDSSYLRWYFMLLLIMSLGCMLALEDPATNWKKAITWNFVIVVALAVAMGFTPDSSSEDTFGLSDYPERLWTYIPLALFSIATLVIFISLYKKNRLRFRKASYAVVSIVLIAALGVTFVCEKEMGYWGTDPVSFEMMNTGDNLQIDDIQDYRSDVLDMYNYDVELYDYETASENAEKSYATYSQEIYEKYGVGSASSDTDTDTDSELVYTYEDALRRSEESDYAIFIGVENVTMYWQIPGLTSFHSSVNNYIGDFMEALGLGGRLTASYYPFGMYGVRSLLSAKYLFDSTYDAYDFVDGDGETLMPGWTYLKSIDGFEVYENEYVLPMGFTYDNYILSSEFEAITAEYRHLVLLNSMVVQTFDDMILCSSIDMNQTFSDSFDFTREQYYQDCLDRMEIACYDFEYTDDGFTAKIDTEEKEEYVFFSVPYDEGWSATVNGESAEIMKVNYAFMAVKVPANQTSEIEFTYHTSGFYYGMFVSVVCIVFLLIYVAAMRFMALPQQPAEETDGSGNDGENGKRGRRKKPKLPGGSSGDDTPPDDTPTDSNSTSSTPTDSSGGGEITSDSADTADKPVADTDSASTSESENTDAAVDEKSEEKPFDPFAAEDISLFDIVKETEEQNMMHTYARVPVCLEHGYGAVGYDVEDKRYIDFTSGIGVNCLGYSDGRWLDAVENQAKTIQHTSNMYYNTTQIQLAELMCMKTGFNKVFFVNSGAEANECAIKLARKYGHDKHGYMHTHIVALNKSFHGRTVTTLSATGQDVFHEYFEPFTEGFSFAEPEMDSVKNTVNENTCAVMIELIQGEGGVNPLDESFVKELSEYCKENDLLLIVDEIQTGMGRTGKLFCYENFGIQPDIITAAKGLGGGLPIGACLCAEPLGEVFTPGTNGTTFGGNPVVCAGATYVLDKVSDEDFLKDVRKKSEYMKSEIEKMYGVAQVRGMGLMLGIKLERGLAKDVMLRCAENGLLVLTAKDVIRLLPPLNIDYLDIDEGLDILERSIYEVLSESADDTDAPEVSADSENSEENTEE